MSRFNRFNFSSLVLVALSLISSVRAATVTYNLNVTWMYGNPDGRLNRPVIGINGQWPLPTLYATKGDLMVVNVYNGLGNASTSIHFHGIFQNGTTNMDGAVSVTQCPIPAGKSFTYQFTVNQAGSYWYHSHLKGQYPDGLRGAFIIHDPDAPFSKMYDEEVVLTFSDWYHGMMDVLVPQFMGIGNPTGAEPIPDSAVMNDTHGVHFNVQPGKTYLFRLINIGAFAAHHVWFEGHTMTIVEVDGAYTQPTKTDLIYIAVAQRYAVLVTTKNDTSANFPIVGAMDQDLFDKIPDRLQPNVTGWLVYDSTKPLPDAMFLDQFDDFDDFNLVPSDNATAFPTAQNSIQIDILMMNLDTGSNYGTLNNVAYVPPKVPTLFSVMSLGTSALNPAVYGINSNAHILERGQVIEIVLNNNDIGKHPFHLHGHKFQLVSRSAENAGNFVQNASTPAIPAMPMTRDVVTVRPGGNLRIRFVADNPGIWLFHCHIEWHTIAGLVATMIEAPLDIQSSLKIPQDQLDACNDLGIMTSGNAAGNLKDPLDLSGANTAPGYIPNGFTARGIVAMVFSCVAAFLGCAVIIWYGLVPLKG